jgi:glycerophosphoryl diester phosphodiesterase
VSGIKSSITLSNNEDYTIVANSDLLTSKWITIIGNEQKIYVDANRRYLFVSIQYENITEITDSIPGNSTVYLSKYNVKNGELSIIKDNTFIQYKYDFSQKYMNTIYSNKYSKIIYSQRSTII